MNLTYFKDELIKTSGIGALGANVGLSLLDASSGIKKTRAAAMNLGKTFKPAALKPANAFTFEGGRYSGIAPSGKYI